MSTTTLRRVATLAFSWALMLSVIGAAVALIVVPKATDSRPLTVLSGSMTGTYDLGDVVVVRPVDTDDLVVGDVITFQPVSDDPSLTTHRITAVSYGSAGTTYTTQGDANDAADPRPVVADQVMGRVWYSVPEVGRVSVWMAGGWLRNATDLAAIGLLVYGGWAVASGLVARRRRVDAPAAEQVTV